MLSYLLLGNRFWTLLFTILHVTMWATFIVLAFVLVWYDQPLLITIYNVQAAFYVLFSWVIIVLAYRIIYTNTIAKLKKKTQKDKDKEIAKTKRDQRDGRSSTSSTRKSMNTRIRERQLINIRKLTRVAFTTMAVLSLMFVAIIIATGLPWTKTPLGYFVNIGIIYRACCITILV
jgi:Flp pilus assembly protein TadB